MWESFGTLAEAGDRAAGGATPRIDAWLLRIADAATAGVIFLLPLIMGGRDAIGQLVLAVLAVTAALAWTIRQTIRGGDLGRPLAAIIVIALGAALLLLQSVPLPQSWVLWLAPHQADLLPLWNAAAAAENPLGRWAYISFAPAETRAGLVSFLSYALLLLVALQRVRSIDDVERILRWCALSALCTAAFGLLQFFTANGKFFWFYEYPYTDTFNTSKGGFTNANHFAHFLALGTGPLIWWLFRTFYRTGLEPSSGSPGTLNRRSKKPVPDFFHRSNRGLWKAPPVFACAENASHAPLLGLALALVLFAGTMSFSRGGIGALGLAVLVSLAFYCKVPDRIRQSGGTRESKSGFAAAGAAGTFSGGGPLFAALALSGALMVSALFIFGLDKALGEMESAFDVTNKEKDWSGGRLAIWRTAAKIIPDFLWTGTGVGTFSEVYPAYEDGGLSDRVEFTHAENSLLQCVVETGILGGGALLAGLAICGCWCAGCWKSGMRLKSAAGAIAAALAAVTAQAMVDFVWHVPACAAMTVILAGCAPALRRLSKKMPETSRSGVRPVWIAVVASLMLAMMGAWMICSSVGPAVATPYWNRYLIARTVAKSQKPGKANVVPAETDEQLIDCLEKAVYWNPSHARAHLALADLHLRAFEASQESAANRMRLTSIRDAALHAGFPSQEALFRWLDRAVGDPVRHLTEALSHCRQSLALHPLEADAYVRLAELSFLDGNHALSKQRCISQALRLRPYDGDIAYVAASESLLAGDVEQWLNLLKRSYDKDRQRQRRIIGDLVGRTPPQRIQGTIGFICEHFRPDSAGMQFLYEACAKRCPAERLVELNRDRARLTESEAVAQQGNHAAVLWLSAQNIHSSLGDGPRALDCARKAVQCDPHDYRARYRLALCLLEQKRYAEAESAFEWCRKRRPNDKNLENVEMGAIKSRLKAERENNVSTKK